MTVIGWQCSETIENPWVSYVKQHVDDPKWIEEFVQVTMQLGSPQEQALLKQTLGQYPRYAKIYNVVALFGA